MENDKNSTYRSVFLWCLNTNAFKGEDDDVEEEEKSGDSRNTLWREFLVPGTFLLPNYVLWH